MVTTSPADFNARIIAEFRANGGRVSGPLSGTPLLLLHHVGARSGVERVVPLAYHRLPGERFAVVAANGGSPRHPAWYHNLKANPRVTVEVGVETLQFMAHELDDAARYRLWPTIVAEAPAAGEFQDMVNRTIPVFILSREV